MKPALSVHTDDIGILAEIATAVPVAHRVSIFRRAIIAIANRPPTSAPNIIVEATK
jgi:hypothetical protein